MKRSKSGTSKAVPSLNKNLILVPIHLWFARFFCDDVSKEIFYDINNLNVTALPGKKKSWNQLLVTSSLNVDFTEKM